MTRKTLSGVPFDEQCYALLRRVPRGKVTTYSELAHALGCRAYRAIGNAMNRNPYAPEVPCHRVVRKDGSVGGFAYGTPKKIKLLKSEGIEINDGKIENMNKRLFRFRPNRKSDISP